MTLFATFSPEAFAGSGPIPLLPGASAVAEYVESVPTAKGGISAPIAPSKPAALPPKIAHAITSGGGADAPLLREIVTSASYGAPPVAKSQTKGHLSTGPARISAPRVALPLGRSSAAGAFASAAAGFPAVLLMVVALLSIGGLAAAVRR